MAAAAVLIGWYVSIDGIGTTPLVLPLLMVCAFCMVSSANIANDLDDVQLDRMVHPKRALASGSISPRIGIILLIIVLLVVVISYGTTVLSAANPITFWIIVIAFLSMVYYERTAKNKGTPGNIIVAALTAFPFLLGASVPGISGKVVLLCPMAFTVNLSREFLKEIIDIEGDKGHRLSFPIVHGIDKTIRASDLAITFALISSTLPLMFWKTDLFFVVPVAIADIIFVSASILSRSRVGLSVQLLKGGMVLGLIGFIFL
ncbi:MAG: UbiA family prenyltransferase [Candidatus Thermoplasmatota archaeon]|jgi:4-hydroxybenzoate polyprenyltransferase|nr:UbiA family prenyltransferase [Candidatus Thermoplasmatota archaeon]